MKRQGLCLIAQDSWEVSLDWAPHRGRKKLFRVRQAPRGGIAMTTNQGASKKKKKDNFESFGRQDNF